MEGFNSGVKGLITRIRCKLEPGVTSVIQEVPGCEFNCHPYVVKIKHEISDDARSCHYVPYINHKPLIFSSQNRV
jgi:hypothetical protein